MENEKNNEKGKNVIIGILLGIIVCLVIALILVCYNKYIAKDDNEINGNTNSTSEKENDTPIVFYSYNVENGKLEKNVVVNEKEIFLKYENSKLIINNKTISVNRDVNNIYIYNDLVFIRLYSADGALYQIYDGDGNLIKELNDSTIKYAIFYEELTLSSNKLLVEVQNIGNTGPYIKDKVMVCGCGQCGDENKIDSYMNEISDSSLYAKAIFEIIYDKTTKKIDVKLDHVTQTVKDYINTSGQRCVSVMN